jgi:hypothetical protein
MLVYGDDSGVLKSDISNWKVTGKVRGGISTWTFILAVHGLEQLRGWTGIVPHILRHGMRSSDTN